jgi:hypothetical protein
MMTIKVRLKIPYGSDNYKYSIKLQEELCHKRSRFHNGVKMAAILIREKSKTSLIGINGSRGIGDPFPAFTYAGQ